MSHPQTDIVIPVHGALEHLQECLRTLEQHTTNYRLIFVDDFSDEATAAYLRAYCATKPDSLLIRTNKQKWFTRASNLGLRMVRTSPSVLLNSDVVVDANWLEELFDVWSEAEKITGKPTGLVGSVLSGEEPRRWADILNPGYVTGHCWLLNIHAISQASTNRGMPGWYLDEVQQISIHIRSDVFLCYDLQKLGYSTIASFKSAVGHLAGKSWGHNLGALTGLRTADLD